MFYSVPIYGPVRNDGKQTITVMENDAGRTYTADKNKVDEFASSHNKSVKNSYKSCFGFFGALLGQCAMFSENAKVKTAGKAAFWVGIAYGAIKLINAIKNRVDAGKVLDEIKKTQ